MTSLISTPVLAQEKDVLELFEKTEDGLYKTNKDTVIKIANLVKDLDEKNSKLENQLEKLEMTLEHKNEVISLQEEKINKQNDQIENYQSKVENLEAKIETLEKSTKIDYGLKTAEIAAILYLIATFD